MAGRLRLKFKERMKEIEQKRLLVLRTKEEELKKKKLKTLQMIFFILDFGRVLMMSANICLSFK